MSERVEAIAEILSSDDLSFGVKLSTNGESSVTMSGGGYKSTMTPKAARAILTALEDDWGKNNPACLILSGMIVTVEREIAAV